MTRHCKFVAAGEGPDLRIDRFRLARSVISWLAASALLAVLLLVGSPAGSLICLTRTEQQYRRDAVLVFEGTMQSTGWSPPSGEGWERKVHTFKVAKYLKGTGPKVQVIAAGGELRRAGELVGVVAGGVREPLVGERWRIYAASLNEPGAPLATSQCRGSFDLRDRRQVLASRAQEAARQAPANYANSVAKIGMLVLGGVGLVSALLLMSSRRNRAERS